MVTITELKAKAKLYGLSGHYKWSKPKLQEKIDTIEKAPGYRKNRICYDMSRVRANAREIGVRVKVSTLVNKKIDIFRKNGEGELILICSIGLPGQDDYTLHQDEKKRLAWIANNKKSVNNERGIAGWYHYKLLWN